jgi:NodT family efflux transporter outer membrane factor (OMF) lipoprotein
MIKRVTFFLLIFFLASCVVGPNYKKAPVVIPAHFKEAPPGWKMATPKDDCDRGPWWEIFNDPELNQLEVQVGVANQNIAAAFAQYQQARALVTQARAAYYPVLSATTSATREKRSTDGTTSSSVVTSNTFSTATSSPVSAKNPFTDYNLELDASWAPDIWGKVRRTVEAAVAGEQATIAQLAAVRLMAQTSLAQYYFELRGLDGDQKVLDDTVENYKKLLKITENQYAAGTASRANILQIQSLLELAQVQAIDNGINRALYEHAIAVLLGKPPALFALAPKYESITPPTIPIELPSTLLERRPDIAQAERLVAQANANIGVAIAAFYPVLTIPGSEGFNSIALHRLLTKAANFWSIGGILADTLFDGGLRSGQVAQARGIYDQMVAQYRQTVLAAFQNVEDNLATLRILDAEMAKQNQAVVTAKKSLELILNEYKAGTVALADTLNAELTLFTAVKGANDISYRRMVASVGLINALGGGWDATDLTQIH